MLHKEKSQEVMRRWSRKHKTEKKREKKKNNPRDRKKDKEAERRVPRHTRGGGGREGEKERESRFLIQLENSDVMKNYLKEEKVFRKMFKNGDDKIRFICTNTMGWVFFLFFFFLF